MANVPEEQPVFQSPTAKPGKSLPSRLWLAIRVIFVMGILGLVASRLDFELLQQQVAKLRLLPLLGAFLIVLVAQVIVALRWHLLLRVSGHQVSIFPLLAFHLVGIFYSQFLPTNVSGDLVKGYYLARTQTDRLTVFSSALVDRIIGLLTNSTIGFIALLQSQKVLAAFDISPSMVRLILVMMMAALLVGGGILFIMRRWQHQLPAVVGRTHDILDDYLRYPLILIGAVILSAIFFLVWALSLWLLASAVEIEHLSYLTMLLVLAAVNVAQFVPLSINGWGVREGALVGLLRLYDVAPEQAVLLSLLTAAQGLLVAGLGGMFVLMDYQYRVQAGEKV